MADYKGFRIAVDNNVVSLENVDLKGSEQPAVNGAVHAATPDTTGGPKSNTALIGAMIARKSAGYFAQNYGNITGDSTGQQQLGEFLGLSGMIGVAATGPLGMAAVGIGLTTKVIDRGVSVSKSRTIANTMQARLGISRSGSRYGANN